MQITTLWLTGLSLLAVLHGGRACSCLPTTDTDKYCDADFVVLAVVQSGLINPNGQQDFDDYYEVNIVLVYKSPYGSCLKKKTRVYTATNGALCGVYLEENKVYVLSGNLDGSRLVLGLCNSIADQLPAAPSVQNLLTNPPAC